MNNPTMEPILSELEAALPKTTWSRTDGPTEHGAVFVQGEGDGWKLTLCAFDIENQGFPPGSRGYDGAAVKGNIVLRLTRELAEKAFKLAEGKLT